VLKELLESLCSELVLGYLLDGYLDDGYHLHDVAMGYSVSIAFSDFINYFELHIFEKAGADVSTWQLVLVTEWLVLVTECVYCSSSCEDGILHV